MTIPKTVYWILLLLFLYAPASLPDPAIYRQVLLVFRISPAKLRRFNPPPVTFVQANPSSHFDGRRESRLRHLGMTETPTGGGGKSRPVRAKRREAVARSGRPEAVCAYAAFGRLLIAPPLGECQH